MPATITAHQEAAVAHIELRRDQLALFREVRFPDGITDAEFAELIDVHRAQVSRVLSGKAAPGTKFIAGVMGVFGPKHFGELFNVITGEEAKQ